MRETLAKFREVYDKRYKAAEEWRRATNGKVIGYTGMYFPDEMIHAAGALPMAIFEEREEEPIALADQHLMPNSCKLVRSAFNGLLKGELDFLDGIAIPLICDQLRFFTEVWQRDHPLPFFYQMWLSYRRDVKGKDNILSELKRFKDSLEMYLGPFISSEALWESIRIYNENRALLRRVCELRREKPGVISTTDMVKVITSSMWMLKEEHNKLLNELIPKFEAEEAPADGKTRVILAGQPCTIPSESILSLIEELGAVVVDDHLYTGGEYPATDVIVNGDPLEALANHYLYRVPSIIDHDPTHYLNIPTITADYADYLVDMVRKNEAKGIIFLRVMYCDPFDFQFVPVNNKLEKEGIPSLSIITEHGVGPLEPIRTRIGAFLETIEG